MKPRAPFKFSLVTGRDFGRAIAWARKQPRLRDLIAAKLNTEARRP